VRYKVWVRILASGRCLREFIKYFDDEQEAIDFCKANTWTDQIRSSIAILWEAKAC
jgi:hypothetical protein